MADELNVDLTTGAPLAIRQQLGSAPKAQKKRILAEYYGQAFTADEMKQANPDINLDEYGGADQLFFVDNGTLKVVDPPGFIQSVFPPRVDVGDIVESGRDVASMIGGGLGTATAVLAGQAGPQVATPEEIYTVPLAAALGAETAGNIYDQTVSFMTPGGIDRGDSLKQAGQTAQNLAVEFAGGRMGDAATRGVKTAVQRGVQRLSGIGPGQRADDMARLGIEGTAATLTGRPSVANLEETLGTTLFAADIIGESRDKLARQLADQNEKIARKFGAPAGSKEEVGSVIRSGTQAVFDRIQAKKTELYDAAYDAAGQITVPLGKLRGLKAELETELAQAPATLKSILGPAIQQIDTVLTDAQQAGGTLPLQTLRAIRTNIGKTIGRPTPGSIKVYKAGDERLPSIYAALSDDIAAAVSAASPQAKRLLDKADRYTKFNAGENLPLIESIQKKNLDSQVFDFALFGQQKGGQRIRQVFANLKRDERDAVSASVLSQLGYRGNASEGAEWSANTFLTNWQRMDKNAKRILFGSPRFKEAAKELDSLARLAKVSAERSALDNRSRTGNVVAGLSQLGPLAASGGLFLFGFPEAGQTALAAAVPTVLAPRYAAKLMTSPKFLRWLKTSAQAANAGVNPLSIQLGRLAALPGKDGELAEAVNAFTLNLQANLMGQQ